MIPLLIIDSINYLNTGEWFFTFGNEHPLIFNLIMLGIPLIFCKRATKWLKNKLKKTDNRYLNYIEYKRMEAE